MTSHESYIYGWWPGITRTSHLYTTLSGWYFHVDLDRADIDKHLTPPGCKLVSEFTHESIQAKHDLWKESHVDMPCRLGDKNQGK